MKARLLRKILNDTNYSISNHEDYIAVGSALCHNLISVNKVTLKVKFALSGSHNDELLFIHAKLEELIKSGEINDIINGKDEIENPLPVFTVEKGKLIESVTDEYGWPNTDDNGIFMYNNTHFKTKEEAIEYGIKESESGIECDSRRIKELQQDIEKLQSRIKEDTVIIEHLKSI